MEAKRERAESEPTPAASAAAAPAAAAASVLCDDDLLHEILLHLDFPTCLVRAAAVCRRWLRAASDPTFLHRFRGLHPPRLLGSYVVTTGHPRVRFVPMPQPPEVAAVIRRGSFDLPDDAIAVSDCRNGRLIVLVRGRYAVYSPLHPARGTVSLPRIYMLCPPTVYRPLLPEDAGDRTAVTLVLNDQRVCVHLSDLQEGAWGEGLTSDLTELPKQWRNCAFGLLAYGKLYMIRMVGHILGLDLQSRSLFYINLPEGVEYESDVNFELSRAEGSGFYLIHAKGFEIFVWLHSTGCSSGNWELVNSFCLHQVLGHLADPTWHLECDNVQVAAVGDNADFVLLQIKHEVFCMHIRSRTVKKVYESQESELDIDIHPFVMVWPPTFPGLNDGRDLVE
uniref:Uncharacterized protein n=1 Tax=Arundo donax TaxID=35708 RepID=A0A0A9GCW6_ARUDO